jgi:hypothetical protein
LSFLQLLDVPLQLPCPTLLPDWLGLGLLLNPPTIFDLGITTALNHVAIQLFVAGLKPSIRDEMMKNMPVLLWDAFQQAITLEKIHTPLKANTPMVN